MKYYIYPSKMSIGDSVLLEITKSQRDVQLFAEFECEDILDVIFTGQYVLLESGFNTSNTVLTLVD
ncbi:TPA: hypothetical protein ACGEHY_005282 [Klebsiella variicola]